MAQAARRLTDAADGFLAGHQVLICGRDGKWTEEFRGLLDEAGVRIVLTPVQAPNANAHAERFVRSIREESGPTDLVRGTAPDPRGRRVRSASPQGTEPSGAR